MLEGTNLAVGAGTAVPFETVSAPWIEGTALAARLNGRKLPGVRFDTLTTGTRTVPGGGVRVVLTDTQRYQPATTAVHILSAVRDLHPGRLRFAIAGGRHLFDLVWGTDTIRKAIERGQSADRIVAGWGDALQRFQATRQRYLLYPRAGP
jgi:uncharacterized protein YbbC (DUF1343 family)